MKLFSMKRQKDEKNDDKACDPCHAESPDYPYGTRLNLEEDQLESLGLKAMPAAGAQIRIEGVGEVIGVREEQIEGKIRRSLEIQITDLGLGAVSDKSTAQKLYDKEA